MAHKVFKKDETDATENSEGVLPNGRKETRLIKINWPAGNGANYVGKRLMARSRYRAQLTPIMIMRLEAGTCEIYFEEPQYALSSGQSLVMYDGAICVGGGVIA